MGFFSKPVSLEVLRGYKKIKINGMRFTIRRINPFLDFHSDNMPQIFTDIASARTIQLPALTPELVKKYHQDMYAIIKAGVVDPIISKDGISVEDLFRDMDIGIKLYHVILDHSLNRFRGLKKLFFSIKLKYNSFIAWQRLTRHVRAPLYARMNSQILKDNSSISLSS